MENNIFNELNQNTETLNETTEISIGEERERILIEQSNFDSEEIKVAEHENDNTIGLVKPTQEFSVEDESEVIDDDDEDVDYEAEAMTKFSTKEKQLVNEAYAQEVKQDEERIKSALQLDSGVVKANNSKAFNSNINIRSIGKELECEAIDDKLRNKRAEYSIAANSYKVGHGSIMKGYVAAMDDQRRLQVKDKKTGELKAIKTFWLIVYDGPIAVYIPVQQFARFKIPSSASKSEATAILRNYCKARIGSEIEYMVMSFNENTREAVGTRLPVLDRKITQYFLTKQRGRDYLCKEGDIVEARVTYIAATAIGVEIFGVDTSIPIIEVSWARVLNLFDYYRSIGKNATDLIGKTVPVKILKINKDSTGVDVVASIKRVFDERALYVNHLKPGRFYTGVIVNIDQNGIFAKIDNLPFSCICNVKEQVFPMVGDKVQLSLTSIRKTKDEYEDLKYEIAAMITRIWN